MRKGTFSVKKAGKNSKAHNSRIEIPNYLIDTSNKNYYELITPDENFIIEALQKYKATVNQKMQQKQLDNLILETVLTIKPNQNETDIKNLFSVLKEKYGGHHLLEVSIHRDEGHFLKDDIAYYPTKNILKKSNDWFICSNYDILKPKFEDFDKLVNINEFEKIYNYHAHAKFSMFDFNLGKTARMGKKDMSERIKIVSDFLGLEYNPNNETRRLKKNINFIKDEHLIKARVLEKVKSLQDEINLSNELKKSLKLKIENDKNLAYSNMQKKGSSEFYTFKELAKIYSDMHVKAKAKIEILENDLIDKNKMIETLKQNTDLISTENQNLKLSIAKLEKENLSYKELVKENLNESTSSLKNFIKDSSNDTKVDLI